MSYGKLCSVIVSLFCVSGLLVGLAQAEERSVSSLEGKQSFLKSLPVCFVENQGQADSSIKFYTQGQGTQVSFTSDGIYSHIIQRKVTHNSKHKIIHEVPQIHEKLLVLKKKFVGANTQCEIVGEDPLPGTVNYLLGDDTTRWKTGIRTYRQIRYKEIYPGVDLVYHGTQGPAEYDLVVNPKAHTTGVSAINQLQFSIDGADKLEVTSDGDLLIHTALGIIREKSPISWQTESGNKQPVSSRFNLLENNVVSFHVDSYNTAKPLVIDPLIYSTLVGGSYADTGQGIAVDSVGNVFITGYSRSSVYPLTTGAYDTSYNGDLDIFVMKLNPETQTLYYSTYVGGLAVETPKDVKIDVQGNAYIAGSTDSNNFPTTVGAIDRSYNGSTDGFLFKLNSSGTSLVYSTYIGGSGKDQFTNFTLDTVNNVYLCGVTYSSNFPAMSSSFSTTYMGLGDVVVVKVHSSGTTIQYSTLLGGNDNDYAIDIDVDNAGFAYVFGNTMSADYPTTPSVYRGTRNSSDDCFVTKLNTTGSTLTYSTFLGGSSFNYGTAIEVDNSGYVYAAGYTYSTGFPVTAGTVGQVLNGPGDSFVIKLNATGSALNYSTLLGGSNEDFIDDIDIDSRGNCYVVGNTTSTDYPVKAWAYQTTSQGANGAFLTKLNPTATAILYSTYLGGNLLDYAYDVSVDTAENAYLTGNTVFGSGFPTTVSNFGAYFGGDWDTYVAKFQTDISDFLPEAGNLPDVKLFKDTGLSNAYALKDYNTKGEASSYAIVQNFLNKASLSESTVTQNTYSLATIGVNKFTLTNVYGTYTAATKVKYSTYKIKKLPWISLRPNQTEVFNMSDYCSKLSGPVLAPTFGNISSLLVSDTTKLQVRWINSAKIEITATSRFTTAEFIQIIAAPAISPTETYTDWDTELLWVYPDLLSSGTFSTSNSLTEQFGVEGISGLNLPTISHVASADDYEGTTLSGVVRVQLNNAATGVKLTPKVASMIQGTQNQWYVARMRLCSNNIGNSAETHLFNFRGMIPADSHIDVGGNILFGVPSTWYWLEVPIYSNGTGLVYPQIIFKGSTSTTVIFLQSVQLFKATPTLMSTTRSKHLIDFAYKSSDSLEMLNLGWSTTEPFSGDINNRCGFEIHDNNVHLNFAGAGSGANLKGSKLTAKLPTGEIYTPLSTGGVEVGVRADVRVDSGTFNTYDSIFMLACYGVKSNMSYDFWSPGGQIIVSAEFGKITDGYHYVVGPGRNRYHQFQYSVKNDKSGLLEMREVDFMRDGDDPYFGVGAYF